MVGQSSDAAPDNPFALTLNPIPHLRGLDIADHDIPHEAHAGALRSVGPPSVAQPEENRGPLHVPHRDVGHVDTVKDTAVDNLQGKARVSSVVDGTVVDVDILESTSRLGAELDRRCVGTDDTVRNHDIRARTFRRAFQDDRVVVAVDPAVGDSDLMTTVDVQPVLVSTRGTWQMARPLNVRIDPTVDCHSVDRQIGTSEIMLHPRRRVSQRHISDRDAPAPNKVNQMGPHFGEFRGQSAVAVNRPVSNDPDVLRILGVDQTSMREVMLRSTGEQDRAGVKTQNDVTTKHDRAREKCAAAYMYFSATMLGTGIDCRLNRAGGERRTISNRAEIADVNCSFGFRDADRREAERT